jgi:serine/threonine-protein kinase
MDYAPGSSLDTYARDDALLPLRTVVTIAIDVAQALDYAHERNVVHRDIKPSNIIYDPDTESVKVTDFGIAFLTDDSKTKTGLILGSPSYMSPEQVAGKKLDGRSDLYSLGVTMFQLVTGQLPFAGDSLANLMYKITNNKAPSAASLRKNLNPCISRLIAKSLQKEADKRYVSGSEMAEALHKCLAQLKK